MHSPPDIAFIDVHLSGSCSLSDVKGVVTHGVRRLGWREGLAWVWGGFGAGGWPKEGGWGGVHYAGVGGEEDEGAEEDVEGLHGLSCRALRRFSSRDSR